MKNPKWMKQKKGPNFLLDFRRDPAQENQRVNSQVDGQPANKRFKSVYHFIPTLKPPKNPQMRKIEAYFVTAGLLREIATSISSRTCRW